MTTITLDQAQLHLREIIERQTADSELVITQDSRPLARLIPAAAPELPQPVFVRGRGKVIVVSEVGKQHALVSRPEPGLCKGMITVISEDDDHLQDFKEYMP